MNHKLLFPLVGMLGAGLLGPTHASAQTVVQETALRNALLTAIAIGRARATVDVNVIEAEPGRSLGATRQTVVVNRPITVIAPPGTDAAVRIGVTRQ